jgi:hypothetical protein
MAKAANKSTPPGGEWLPLDQAFDRIVQRVHSPDAAEARIRRILQVGQWRGESFDGTETFDGTLLEGSLWSWATLDIPNCAASFGTWPGIYDDAETIAGYRAKISGIACIEIFMATDSTENIAQSNKVWITAEVKRREAAGDIPNGITEFSEELQSALAKVAITNKRLRVLKARTIENRLREWELWPFHPPR